MLWDTYHIGLIDNSKEFPLIYTEYWISVYTENWLKVCFFGRQKNSLVIEYPHRFEAAAIIHDTKEQTDQIGGKSLSERQQQSIDP